jgi:hypothetical protein
MKDIIFAILLPLLPPKFRLQVCTTMPHLRNSSVCCLIVYLASLLIGITKTTLQLNKQTQKVRQVLKSYT